MHNPTPALPFLVSFVRPSNVSRAVSRFKYSSCCSIVFSCKNKTNNYLFFMNLRTPSLTFSFFSRTFSDNFSDFTTYSRISEDAGGFPVTLGTAFIDIQVFNRSRITILYLHKRFLVGCFTFLPHRTFGQRVACQALKYGG